MLPFLKAPADAPLMTDKHEIDARYRYWRRHIPVSYTHLTLPTNS
ncbi:hypothetical protein ACX3VG_28190, partial [Escherichia coli]